jgi:hypothetical protein
VVEVDVVVVMKGPEVGVDPKVTVDVTPSSASVVVADPSREASPEQPTKRANAGNTKRHRRMSTV